MMFNMKKLLWALTVFTLSLTNHAYSECEVRVGFEQWEPYQFKDSNGNFTGLDLEVVRTALQHSSCKTNFVQTSWQRLLVSIENGDMDVAMGASKTPDREKYSIFSIPYRDETYALFLRKNDNVKYQIKTLDDLVENNFRFGIVRGYFYGETFHEAMKNPRFKALVEETKNDDANIRKLQMGRIQGCFIDPYAGIFKLRKMGLSNQIEKSPFAVESGAIHAMFSKKTVSPDIIKAFNDGLEKMKNSGQLVEIIRRYLD